MTKTIVEHKPVLLNEALELLRVRVGGVYVDGTLGSGGHSDAILSRFGGSGKLIGLDLDSEALDRARHRLNKRFNNFQTFQESFKNLTVVLGRMGISGVHGCLLDLGVSSEQLGSSRRGFSFMREGPLDMRMDLRQTVTAEQLVNQLSEQQLAEVFRKYGEEMQARRIATAIVEHREKAPLRTTTELAQLVERVKKRHAERIHPATRVFQALRIEVNQELTNLESSLDQIVDLILPGGRLVVIVFHSLEDRIVKTVFRRSAGKCVCFRPRPLCKCPRVKKVELLTRRPVTANNEELSRNPRSRSAKLRALEIPITNN